jgi:hypothetical protein
MGRWRQVCKQIQVCARALDYSHGPAVLGTMAVRPWTLAKQCKGCCTHLHAPPSSHIPCPLHRGIRQPYPKWATRLVWACQCLGFKGKTCQLGQSRLEQIERGMKWHKGWPAAGTSGASPRGPGVIPNFYAKPMYSLYAWPRINCSTHTAQKCSQTTKYHK